MTNWLKVASAEVAVRASACSMWVVGEAAAKARPSCSAGCLAGDAGCTCRNYCKFESLKELVYRRGPRKRPHRTRQRSVNVACSPRTKSFSRYTDLSSTGFMFPNRPDGRMCLLENHPPPPFRTAPVPLFF